MRCIFRAGLKTSNERQRSPQSQGESELLIEQLLTANSQLNAEKDNLTAQVAVTTLAI